MPLMLMSYRFLEEGGSIEVAGTFDKFSNTNGIMIKEWQCEGVRYHLWYFVGR